MRFNTVFMLWVLALVMRLLDNEGNMLQMRQLGDNLVRGSQTSARHFVHFT